MIKLPLSLRDHYSAIDKTIYTLNIDVAKLIYDSEYKGMTVDTLAGIVSRKLSLDLRYINDGSFEFKQALMSYIADEIFMTGTAAEITPICTVDKIKIKEGKRGPITKQIQDYYFGVLNGSIEDKFGWLTFVSP